VQKCGGGKRKTALIKRMLPRNRLKTRARSSGAAHVDPSKWPCKGKGTRLVGVNNRVVGEMGRESCHPLRQGTNEILGAAIKRRQKSAKKKKKHGGEGGG